ncbi:MAG TPA: ABC transporter permease [Limnochordales bacterium]
MTSGSRVVTWLGVLRLSARQLQRRWLESVLIVLGIALGVAVLTAGQSLVSFQTGGLIELLAQDMAQWRAVTVRARRVDVAEQFFGPQAVPAVPVSPEVLQEPVHLTLADILAVREEVPGVAFATVEFALRIAQLVAVDDGPPPGPGQPTLQVEMVTPDEFAFRRMRFVAGGPFTWEDVLARRAVLVLEESSVRRLFPDLPPADVVGRTVTDSAGSTGARYQIVGVVAPGESVVAQLNMMTLRQSEGDVVYGFVPAASRPWLGPDASVDPLEETFDTVYFTPEDDARTPEVVAAIEAYFGQKYGAGVLEVLNPQAQREEMLSWLRPAMLAILVLAGLGLLIAAVNILNLFTARVLRRQRMIGTSMALGASRRLLFWQMSGEALLLGVVGSLLGLALASGLIGLLRTFFIAQAGGDEIYRQIYEGIRLGLGDALVGLAVGVAMSLLFGIYPAVLGARQNPAEALRVE